MELQKTFNAIDYMRATMSDIEFRDWLKNEGERLEFDFFKFI